MATETKEERPYCGYDSCDVWTNQIDWLWERMTDRSDLTDRIDDYIHSSEDRKECRQAIDTWFELGKAPEFKTDLKDYLELEHKSIFRELEASIEKDASEDSFVYQQAYEDVQECLTELMEELNNPYNGWRVDVSNFGWQKRNGYKTFKADNGKEMLREVLPNCECTFSIYKEEGAIRISNAHHDSPCDGEGYYIRVWNREDEEE